MRKTLILVASMLVGATACNTAPAPVQSPAPPPPVSSPPAQSSSPSAVAAVVNGCSIQPATSCEGASLRRASIHDANLKGSDFKNADFFGADLRNTDLRGADLSGANLRNADLTDARLMGATLTGAILQDANLTRANLDRAQVTNAQFVKALRCETTRADGTTDNTGCPADIGSSPSPHPPANQPTIIKFNITPSGVTCPSKNSGQSVKIKYKTRNADSVEFEIDDQPPGASAGYGPKGTATLAFDCHEAHHTYKIVATGKTGKTASQQATVRQTA